MFEHLQKLEVAPGAVSWMDLPELGPKARLKLAMASEANPAYYNAMLKRSGKRIRQAGRKDGISAEDIAQNRAEDRDLFPMRVLVGWDEIRDVDGKFVEFNAESAKELCQKLPWWLFDRVRNHASAPERFLPDGDLPPDAEELAGNSSSASGSN